VDDPESWFTALYDRHHPRVLAYALTHADQGMAEDVSSETFLIAWRRLDDIPDPALPWLLGVARNLLHKQRDGGRRRERLADRVSALTTPADLAGWDVAEHVVERDAALAAIASLSDKDAETLALVSWHGLDPHDAAKVVGCTSATFFVRLHRARRRLADALASPPTAARPRTAATEEAPR
jgi:RNA polymerase sigma-70 factor, ECF subfamily